MAKKRPTLPKWLQKLTKRQLDRLEQLRKIADDVDTCEMETIRMQKIRKGGGQGLWLVGSLNTGSRRARKKR